MGSNHGKSQDGIQLHQETWEDGNPRINEFLRTRY